jgi:hypothetical protein
MKVDRRSVMSGGVFAAFATSSFGVFESTASAETKMPSNTIEFVSFRLVGGVSEQDFLKTLDSVNGFLKSQKGFVARRLSKDEMGTYFDHVEWATLEDAKAAMQSSMQQAELVPFMQMIDPASMTLLHNQLVVSIG